MTISDIYNSPDQEEIKLIKFVNTRTQARREMEMAEKQMRLHQPAIGEMEAIQAATAGQRPRVQLLADARKMTLRTRCYKVLSL